MIANPKEPRGDGDTHTHTHEIPRGAEEAVQVVDLDLAFKMDPAEIHGRERDPGIR